MYARTHMPTRACVAARARVLVWTGGTAGGGAVVGVLGTPSRPRLSFSTSPTCVAGSSALALAQEAGWLQLCEWLLALGASATAETVRAYVRARVRE